jgi:SAM-dependent methyltransferase
MAEDPRDDLVARQYKKWQYPEPIENLEAWLATNWDWFDPCHSHRIFWPNQVYQPEMDILVAGCGTNQAPTLAYTNPQARVVGIDISQESLDHGRYLKHKHGLKNLELTLLPIEEVGSLGRDFDLVVSGGVLHHMASPQTGMDALASVLRREGVAAIMLYARYGRIGVEIMQAVFHEMGLEQTEGSLRLVRAGLSWLDPSHAARAYMAIAPDLAFDTGMVDTFLHGRDVSFTVQDCLDLVDGSGLVFQDWFQKTPLHPPTLVEPENEFLAAVNMLPERQMWSVMERLRNLTACHLFLACRRERPTADYVIDFSAPQAVNYVPLWRMRAGVDGQLAVRPNWAIPLAEHHRELALHIDGNLSISEIAERCGQPVAEALELFRQLWRMDFIAVDVNNANP